MFIRKLFSATNVLVKGFQKLCSYMFTTRNADIHFLKLIEHFSKFTYVLVCYAVYAMAFPRNLSLQTKPFLANSYNLF